MRAASLAALLIALATPASAETLRGSWRLIEADPALPEVAGFTAGLRLDEAAGGTSYKIMIGGACNNLGAALDLREGVSFAETRATQQYCRDARGAFDEAFFGAVLGAHEIVREGNHLVVRSDVAQLTFSRRAE